MQALCIFVVLLVSQIAVAGTHSDFESYKQQQTRGAAAARDDFEVYKQKLLAAFEHYKKQTGKVWGNKHNVSPQASNWISFHGDLGHRAIARFRVGNPHGDLAVGADLDPGGEFIAAGSVRAPGNRRRNSGRFFAMRRRQRQRHAARCDRRRDQELAAAQSDHIQAAAPLARRIAACMRG